MNIVLPTRLLLKIAPAYDLLISMNISDCSNYSLSSPSTYRTALADISFVKIQEQRMKNLEKDSRPIKV